MEKSSLVDVVQCLLESPHQPRRFVCVNDEQLLWGGEENAVPAPRSRSQLPRSAWHLILHGGCRGRGCRGGGRGLHPRAPVSWPSSSANSSWSGCRDIRLDGRRAASSASEWKNEAGHLHRSHCLLPCPPFPFPCPRVKITGKFVLKVCAENGRDNSKC